MRKCPEAKRQPALRRLAVAWGFAAASTATDQKAVSELSLCSFDKCGYKSQKIIAKHKMKLYYTASECLPECVCSSGDEGNMDRWESDRQRVHFLSAGFLAEDALPDDDGPFNAPESECPMGL